MLKNYIFIGCPKCYARDIVNRVNRNTMDELYQSTLEKTEYLKQCPAETHWAQRGGNVGMQDETEIGGKRRHETLL